MSIILNSSAFPIKDEQAGFTKLEYGALMIAQGLVSKYNMSKPEDQQIIAELSFQLATEVIFKTNEVNIPS